MRDDYQGIRVTPNIYTTLEEIDTFTMAMEDLLKNGVPATDRVDRGARPGASRSLTATRQRRLHRGDDQLDELGLRRAASRSSEGVGEVVGADDVAQVPAAQARRARAAAGPRPLAPTENGSSTARSPSVAA